MFGFSFWKIVVLVAVIAIVWFGFRWLQRIESERRKAAGSSASRIDGRRPVAAEDLAPCPVCGVYVVAGSPACGRKRCPLAQQ
ncbi:MAG TPA: hypothetical protein VLG66_08515 [Alphaproteobacteria bacterium]|nr:hypothetical protein [Alphaproteobacteria bacterium]